MTEHLPECWATYPSDPPAWCICEELSACEERVRKDQTDRCVDAFYDRISDSDLDYLLSDDGKDIVAQAIRNARQRQ